MSLEQNLLMCHVGGGLGRQLHLLTRVLSGLHLVYDLGFEELFGQLTMVMLVLTSIIKYVVSGTGLSSNQYCLCSHGYLKAL